MRLLPDYTSKLNCTHAHEYSICVYSSQNCFKLKKQFDTFKIELIQNVMSLKQTLIFFLFCKTSIKQNAIVNIFLRNHCKYIQTYGGVR